MAAARIRIQEDVSVAAAIVAAEIALRTGLAEQETYRVWRRMQARMRTDIGRDGRDARISPEADGAIRGDL